MFHVCGTNKYSSPEGISPIYFNCMEIANERKAVGGPGDAFQGEGG